MTVIIYICCGLPNSFKLLFIALSIMGTHS